MDLFKWFRREKGAARPHRIVFEKENTQNTYIDWEDQMKPRVTLDDGITPEEHQALAARWDEMLELAEAIIWHNYLDPDSDDLLSEEDSFPDIRYLTGNYYVADVSYGYTYRDRDGRAYHIKEGRLRHKHHNGKEWLEEWQEMDSPEITRRYMIFLGLHLTGNENGQEGDYMGLDLIAELDALDSPMEFDILSHDVI